MDLVLEVTLYSFFARYCIVFFCSVTLAYANDTQQNISNLAAHNVWRQLLHTEQTAVTLNHSDSHFYLAENGFQDPRAELEATIRAFSRTPQSQCRFPARKRFLEKHLPTLRFIDVVCPEYQEYLNAFSTHSASLIFASGYLGNPASMFGHVFLKFNGESADGLLDNTFSYGAKVPDNENKLVYITKGIFGGYQGKFSNQQYHHHHLTYSETELRDMWEYKLALSQDDIQFLLAHLWELENATMTYYFFEQNCAYQLAKLLSLVFDKPLIAPNKAWVMPFDLLVMMQRQQATRPMFNDVIYHGSRQQTLYDRWQQLTHKEQQTLLQILERPPEDTQAKLATLDETSAIRVIDTLYDYFAFIEQKEDDLTTIQHAQKRQAMIKRFAMAPVKPNWKSVDRRPPHEAQDTTRIGLGLYDTPSGNVAGEVNFRANYYDLLTLNAGRIPYSELTTFNVRLRYLESEGVAVREFTPVRIINLNASESGLPLDSNWAWKLAFGYREQANNCFHCGAAYIDSFIGKSWALRHNLVGYAALSTSITSSNLNGGFIAVGSELGGVAQVTSEIAMSLAVGQQWFVNQPSRDQHYLSVIARYSINQRWDVRANIDNKHGTDFGLLISHYY
jgi:hypothetical protein